jgi:cytoskeleton protein RodZ
LAVTPKRFPMGKQAGLAELRAAAGLSLHQIADSTKISVRFLSAIENGQLDELPGGVIGRSYIKQYAAAVGGDPAPLLKSIEEPATNPEPPARQPVRRAEPNAILRFFMLG